MKKLYYYSFLMGEIMQKEETYWKHDIKIPAFSPIHAMVMRNAMYKSVRQVLHYKALPKVLPFAKMKFTLYSAYRKIYEYELRGKSYVLVYTYNVSDTFFKEFIDDEILETKKAYPSG